MKLDESEALTRHVRVLAALALWQYRPVDENEQAFLPGLGSRFDAVRIAVGELLYSELEAYDDSREPPSRFIARLALELSTYLHRAVCASKRSRQFNTCAIDAIAVDSLLQGLALSFLGSQFRSRLDDIVESAVNAKGLSEGERIEALAVLIADRMHPLPGKRAPVEIRSGVPHMQVNAAWQEVDEDLFSRNRLDCQALAAIGEKFGLNVEVTSDYAAPNVVVEHDEVKVRHALLHSTVLVFLMNGAGTGTGRGIELASACLIPHITLRRMSGEAPPPHLDRYSGEKLGEQEYRYWNIVQAKEILSGFLGSQAPQIKARQSDLERWATSALPPEARLVLDAEPGMFHGLRVDYDDARFWTENAVRWAQCPKKGEIRLGLGLPADESAPPQRQSSTNIDKSDERSFRMLLAYGRARKVPYARLIFLLENRPRPILRAPRSQITFSFDDWESLDLRLGKEDHGHR